MAQETLRQIPDLERCVSRLQSARNLKVVHLLDVLEALEKVQCFFEMVQEEGNSANLPLLLQFLSPQTPSVVLFCEKLNEMSNSFDREKAKKDSFIEPRPGVDTEYDKLSGAAKKIREDLEGHLTTQKKRLGVPLKYTHMQKEKYQVEITVSSLEAVTLPNDWQLVSSTKSVQRFYDDFIKQALKALADAEEDFTIAKAGVFQHVLDRFNENAPIWQIVISQMALLDVLCSLTLTSTRSAGIPMCRPTFVSGDNGSYFDIRDVRHPMLCAKNPDQFISNSIMLISNTHRLSLIKTSINNLDPKLVINNDGRSRAAKAGKEAILE